MKVKMSIRSKMLINILATSVIIFVFSVGYMSYKTRILVFEDAEKLALSVTKENALRIEKTLSEDLSVIQTLAKVFTFNQNMEEEEWKDYFAKIAYAVIEDKGNFYGLSGSWEEQYYKPELENTNMRYYYYLQRIDAELVEKRLMRDLSSGFYQSAKKLDKDALMEPNILRNKAGLRVKAHLMSPIQINDYFAGYVVGDFSTDSFQDIVSKIMPYESTVGYLISNAGVIVSHPDKKSIGDTISKYAPHYESQFNLSACIKQGRAQVFNGLDENGNKIFEVIN